MSNIGKVFRTKMSDGSMFRILDIKANKVQNGVVSTAYGQYIGSEHLICPLDMGRLEAKPVDLVEVLEHFFDVRIKRLESSMKRQMTLLGA